ncbi:MAG TPA: cytochrome P450 [Solirubrobacteraceae bacterium]|nr:cytochrome P450 [Solirubrobacteraceae bacterium]
MATTVPRPAATEPGIAEPPTGGAGAPGSTPEAAVPAGPRVHPFLQTLAWAVAPTWVMDRCAARFGEMFTITFWPSGMQLVLISAPEDVKRIFTAPPELAPSSAGNSPVRGVMGEHSVITLTGPEHMRQRKLLLPPFHGERMREYEQTIVQATREDLAGWPLGEPMHLQDRTRAITLEVILRAVFGVEAERMDPLRQAISGLLAPMNPLRLLPIALRMPKLDRPPGAIGRALDRLDAVIYDELARRRTQADLAERTDILSLLMQARDEQGEAMTDPELRDELVTLLLAGHETTATSVAWAIERLVRHPQKLARLVEEIDAGEREDYMTAVVNETLRVRPVVPIVARMLTAEMELGGRRLPAGTRVMPSIYLTNRNPRVYDEPLEFRPERFLDASPDTFSWIPFGGGIRRCIGASFAQLEMRLMLRTMLSELEPGLPPARLGLAGRAGLAGRGEWNRRRAITLVPARGARVVWRERAGRNRSAAGRNRSAA